MYVLPIFTIERLVDLLKADHYRYCVYYLKVEVVVSTLSFEWALIVKLPDPGSGDSGDSNKGRSIHRDW
jgi:hypothetical protein